MEINFGKLGGLVPAIVQDEETGEVLMLGFMNVAAYQETLRIGQAVFFSRSRDRMWRKGEISGHVLKVADIRLDCDGDALLVRVKPVGPGVCHEGYRSCFFRSLNHKGVPRIVAARSFDPQAVYGTPTAVASGEAK
jgi:phosphoribosyl-AMP cyclohydrolase